MSRRTHRLLLLALTSYALAVRLLPGIGRYDFGSAWDEGYYAVVARGAAHHLLNWVYPFVFERSLDRVLINKPPAFFWLGALALHLPLGPELALRLVSVIAGVASIPIFEALCRSYCSRRAALLAALVFASSPLHVALSRVYQMDVVGLFYGLLATYLIVRGIRHRSSIAILASAPIIGLALLTKLWAPVLPVFGLIPFFLCEAHRRREGRTKLAVGFAFAAGLAIFAAWPIALSIWRTPYTGFLWMRRGSRVWDLLFLRYGITRYESGMQQLAAPYLSLGHFHVGTPAIAVEVGLALGGMLFALAKAKRRGTERLLLRRATPMLLWVLAYLPVAMGRDHYLQYLLVLLPAWSIAVGGGLNALLEVRRAGGVLGTALAVALLAHPVYLVLHGDEILYETHYREMGAFIAAHTAGTKGTAECRYAPGLSYYTGRMERPYDSRWPVEERVERGAVRFVDVKRSRRDNTLRRTDRRWIQTHCTDVSEAAGLPAGSLHALYDCAAAHGH